MASALDPTDEPEPVNARRLRQLVTSPPIASPQLVTGEDPFEEPFVTVITFYGGSYRVVSGGVSSASVGCQLLLEAVRDLPDEEFAAYKSDVFSDAFILLSLSERICRRAGLNRWELPWHSPQTKLLVPSETELERLGQSVTFSPSELDELLGAAVGGIGSLNAPGTLELVDHDRESPTDDRIYLYPLIEAHSGDAVVALPSGLAGAITHRALARGVERGHTEALVATLHDALQRSMHRILKRVRWTRVQGPPGLGEPVYIRDAFYRFDIDKLAHVVGVIDPLVDYTAGNPFAHADLQAIQVELHSRFLEVRSAARRESSELSVLHVVCTAPLGRSHVMGFTHEATDKGSTLLAANLDDLDLMVRIEAPDPLGLWKFACASERLHTQTRVMSFSKLDEYAIYRDNGNGFYMGDERRPTFVSIQPGSGGELRAEERRRLDQHAVVLPDGGRVVEVCRWPADDATPVYRPDDESFHSHHVVELAMPCWVVPSTERPEEDGSTEDFAESIAFWLWRCADLVALPLAELSSRLERLLVNVRVMEQSTRPDGDGTIHPVTNWLRCDISASDGRVSLVLLEDAGFRQAGPDNHAEREIATLLVEAIHRVAGLPEDGVRAQLELSIPTGEMKMLQVLESSYDLLLTLGHTPRPRFVPDADTEQLLDEIGTIASENLGPTVGPIALDDRTKVLNALVGKLFESLKALIASLNPNGLLEFFAGEQEAILFMEARNRLLLPSQAACFGKESSAVKKTMRMARDLTSAALANRFILECATAQPPSGDQPLALSAYDRLLSVARQIIEFGFISDAIRYGLSSVEMSVLPSGRLGFNRDEPYQEALKAFRMVISGRSLRDAQRAYASHWARPDDSVAAFDPTELNEAYANEFGISATELSHLSGDLMEMARSEPLYVATRTYDSIVTDLVESLGWSEEKVKASLDSLSLTELDEFPPSTNRADSYPWRYSRNRSAIRRPLLVRTKPGGESQVVWGPRAVYRAGRYLLDLVLSARLRAHSHEMQRYIASVRREGTDEFNREVGRFFRDIGYEDVRENVVRFGSIRLRRPNGEEIGDIDVLVTDRSNKVMLLVEVKDFEFARTPSELSNEFDKLLDGSRSAAHHHEERMDFMKSNLDRILLELGESGPSDAWQVRGAIVTSADLFTEHSPTARALGHGTNVMSFDTLRAQSGAELTGRSAKHRSSARRKKKRRRRRR
ncbi:MAG: hypothetical protein ACR2NT_05685 [Acidimicrobiia bacterium]